MSDCENISIMECIHWMVYNMHDILAGIPAKILPNQF